MVSTHNTRAVEFADEVLTRLAGLQGMGIKPPENFFLVARTWTTVIVFSLIAFLS